MEKKKDVYKLSLFFSCYIRFFSFGQPEFGLDIALIVFLVPFVGCRATWRGYTFFFFGKWLYIFHNQSVKTLFDVNTTTRIYGNPTSYLIFSIFSFPINLMSFRFLWAFSIRSSSIFKLSFLLFLCISFHFLAFFFTRGTTTSFYSFSISINLSSIQLIDDAMCAYIWTFFFSSLCLSLFCLVVLRLSPLSCISLLLWNECITYFVLVLFFRSLIPTDVHDLYIIILYPPQKKYNVL